MRLLFLLVPLIAGCAHERHAGVDERYLHITGPYPESPLIKRCLLYWTSNFSTNATNHFYVGAAEPAGGFTDALVYWKEERTIIEYAECSPDLPVGAEIFAFHHHLKLDRDTVDIQADAWGSSYMVTHRAWVDVMEQCLSRGREYIITLEEARRLSTKRETPDEA